MLEVTGDHEQLGRTRNVDPLFARLGLRPDAPVTIEEIPGVTYEVEERPEDNWVFHALIGLGELQRRLNVEGRRCRHFVTVGTGPGLDAIGAAHLLRPEFLRVTDINPTAAEVALQNLRNNLPTGAQPVIAASAGHLLGVELNEWGAGVEAPAPDVIYANLPNLPASQVDTGTMAAASYIDRRLIQGCPPDLDRTLLALQYHFLRQAREVLAPGGSAVIALGARMPAQVIQHLFHAAGLRMEELYTGFKIQTQPDEVIAGYARAERENGAGFTFYNAAQVMTPGALDTPMTLEQRQWQWMARGLTAQQALRVHQQGHPIGHLVSILRGVKDPS